MPADSLPKGPSKPEFRSRASNGKDLFVGQVDGRTSLARRYRDILGQLVADLGSDLTEAQAQIARRAVTLAVWSEQAEAAMAAGEPLDIAAYATAANSLRRLLADLGLERRMRDVSPTLDEYLRSRIP